MKILWNTKERKLLNSLNTPIKIQRFLDNLAYDVEGGAKSPRIVIRDKRADCFNGVLFAAAALQYHNYKPLIVELEAVNDDGHMLAIIKKDKHFGAIAKSNFTTLKYREPVYKTLRELVMSYFDFYFNTAGQKTLRKYSEPLNLAKFNKRKWMIDEKRLNYIEKAINKQKYYHILTKNMIRRLEKVSKKLLRAGLLGASKKGLYKPKS